MKIKLSYIQYCLTLGSIKPKFFGELVPVAKLLKLGLYIEERDFILILYIPSTSAWGSSSKIRSKIRTMSTGKDVNRAPSLQLIHYGKTMQLPAPSAGLTG